MSDSGLLYRIIGYGLLSALLGFITAWAIALFTPGDAEWSEGLWIICTMVWFVLVFWFFLSRVPLEAFAEDRPPDTGTMDYTVPDSVSFVSYRGEKLSPIWTPMTYQKTDS